jgi:hypothetical protein
MQRADRSEARASDCRDLRHGSGVLRTKLSNPVTLAVVPAGKSKCKL